MAKVYDFEVATNAGRVRLNKVAVHKFVEGCVVFEDELGNEVAIFPVQELAFAAACDVCGEMPSDEASAASAPPASESTRRAR